MANNNEKYDDDIMTNPAVSCELSMFYRNQMVPTRNLHENLMCLQKVCVLDFQGHVHRFVRILFAFHEVINAVISHVKLFDSELVSKSLNEPAKQSNFFTEKMCKSKKEFIIPAGIADFAIMHSDIHVKHGFRQFHNANQIAPSSLVLVIVVFPDKNLKRGKIFR